jgi:cellulose synthase/poly-beta-1,6-N-acetylglucosamine synthase-like glycosyltransferase/exo-beta-1,3-glucanase (GH17 family)
MLLSALQCHPLLTSAYNSKPALAESMKPSNIVASLIVLTAFALLTFGYWYHSNEKHNPDAWPSFREGGFAFQPFQANQDATNDEWPTEQEIEADLKLISTRAINIRTYSARGVMAAVPRLAAKHKLQVMVGAYFYPDDPERTEEEIQAAIKAANEYKNVTRVIIGNETILHNEQTVEQLIATLDRVRQATDKPVSTAEPYHIWSAKDENGKLLHAELINHVDFIAAHFFPYWEGISLEASIDHIVEKKNELHQLFPNKKVIIAEVGWPSSGRTREQAEASPANQANFLRSFLERTKQARADTSKSWQEREFIYYILEAFDQPWKEHTAEGGAGAYWGVWDAYRQPKFSFDSTIEEVPRWRSLAWISVVFAAVLLGVFYLYSHTLQTRGRTFLALVVYGTAIATVYVIYDYSQSYLSVSTVVIGAFLVLGMLGVIAVILAEAHEWAEAHWVTAHGRVLVPASPGSTYRPKVSIHVPAYNEPPEMLNETLDALAALDYDDYEVLVIDNNTKDENVWKPVQAHCEKLGPKFRFFHVSPLAGFKAGALNFALRNTDPDAGVVAVIDSDYKVIPNWLKDLVPAFAESRLGIVQAPQDYRDGDENAFKAMCYAEYRGFFHIGMITRNERNAIIQHGTMTMVRRKLLDDVGGWAEWCITEDAELGLRIFQRGFDATYLPQSYGKGVMPDTFIDFKKQRFRWAYGAMQIMRRHLRSLFSNKGGLSQGQRYHYVAGWLPWIADGFNFLFTLGAIGWSFAMWKWPQYVEPPLRTFSYLPLMLFTFKLAKLLHLYVTRVGANLRQTFAAAMAGLALSHTIGMATLKGLITKSEPFFRTPKLARPHALATAFTSARTETLLMACLWIAAYAVSQVPEEQQGPDRAIWTIMLMIQSLPYLAALVVSLASAFPLPARMIGASHEMQQAVKADTETTDSPKPSNLRQGD